MKYRVVILGLWLLAFLVPGTAIWAQQPPKDKKEETYLRLTQGREVYGIVQKEDEDGVHLLIPGDSYLVVPDSQIVFREQRPQRYRRFRTYNNWRKEYMRYPQQGPYAAVDMGLTFLKPADIAGNSPGFGSHLRAGYAWRPYLMAGVSVGIEGVPRGAIAPLTLEAWGSLTESRISPLYRVQAGWAFGVNQSWSWMRTQGGPTASAGLGWRAHNRSSVQTAVWLNFRYQYVQQTELVWNGTQFPDQIQRDPEHLVGLSLTASVILQ